MSTKSEVLCKRCNGKKATFCAHCEGTGRSRVKDSFCVACAGTGNLPCGVCKGSGLKPGLETERQRG
jgi:hypothetical protein